MPLFDNLEKLITEHGSASILRERLSLAADKYSALEEKVAQLKEENATLRSDLKAARQEIEALRANSPASGTSQRLSEEEEKVLLTLAENDRWLTARAIAGHLGIHKSRVDYYLGNFEQTCLASGSHFYNGGESEYKIGHDGRGYLIKRGLIK